jgi:hypothetical protein
MRYLFILSFYFFGSSCFSNNVKNIVTDFGADPSGAKSSDLAFRNAAKYFNKSKGNGKLIIPFGVYIVGNQLQYPYPSDFNFSIQSQRIGAFEGEDVFVLTNCENFEIVGQVNRENKKPVIKFKSKMKMGVFEPNLNMPKSLQEFTKLAHVGIMFVFRNCENTHIKNIELDGNYNDFVKGGNWPPKRDEDMNGSVQLENVLYGIFICESRKITCENLFIHHFLNGIYLVDLWENIPISKATRLNYSKNIQINKCRISYSIQNNFCFAGADSVYFNSSIFELAARDIVRYSPGAGVGIEPEGNIRSSCKNGFFKKCIFRNNAGFGIGAGSYLPPVETSSFIFDSCEFIGTKNVAANCSANNMKFTNCFFYGKVQSIGKNCVKKDEIGNCQEEQYVNDSYKNGLLFRNCTFSNRYFGFDIETGGATGGINTLLLTEDSPFIEVSNCNFNAYDAYAIFINGVLDKKRSYLKKNEANNFVIFSNNKVYNYTNLLSSKIQFPIPNRSYIIANSILTKNVFSSQLKVDGEQIQCIDNGSNVVQKIGSTLKQSNQNIIAPVVDITYPIKGGFNFFGEQYIIAESILQPITKSELVSQNYIELLPGFESVLTDNNAQVEIYIDKQKKTNKK